MPVGFSLGRSYHARSISLPARSSTPRIQHDHLIDNNLKNVEEMRAGFTILVNLYKYIVELLNMPLTQTAFTRHRHDRWVEDWLDESIIFLDACSATRDSVLLLGTSLGQILSLLRRSKQEKKQFGHDQDLVMACICSLKKLRKETNKSTLAALKAMNSNASTPMWALIGCSVEGRHIVEVIRMLKEASVASNSMFRSTLKCLFGGSASGNMKGSKWALVSKVLAVQKREVVKDVSETEEVDVVINTCLEVLQRLTRKNIDRYEYEEDEDEVATRGLCERLEDLERSLEGVEKEMESLFRVKKGKANAVEGDKAAVKGKALAVDEEFLRIYSLRLGLKVAIRVMDGREWDVTNMFGKYRSTDYVVSDEQVVNLEMPFNVRGIAGRF